MSPKPDRQLVAGGGGLGLLLSLPCYLLVLRLRDSVAEWVLFRWLGQNQAEIGIHPLFTATLGGK
jgi:hypothetical protein